MHGVLADEQVSARRYHVVKTSGGARSDPQARGERRVRASGDDRHGDQRLIRKSQKYRKGTGKGHQGHPRSTEIRVPKCT